MAPAESASPAAQPGSQVITNPIDPSFLDRLDQDFIEYYNQNIGTRPITHAATIADLRANAAKYASPWFQDTSHLPFITDHRLKSVDGHEFTARSYAPDPETSPFGKGPYPIHINFHGGGFCLGGLVADAHLCKHWREKLGIVILDVDYRLCPENAFGKAHDDAFSAILWVHERGSNALNARTDSMSIGGISAGATLSAVCQQLARDAGIPLKLAILAVPCVKRNDEIAGPEESPFPSFRENTLAPCLNWKRIDFFRQNWKPKTDAEREALNARGAFFTSPIEGNLDGLCDTFVAVASADPFRDEGELYARCLMEAGVRVTARRYMGVPHPFVHFKGVRKSEMWLEDATAELKRVHLP